MNATEITCCRLDLQCRYVYYAHYHMHGNVACSASIELHEYRKDSLNRSHFCLASQLDSKASAP